MPTADRDSFRIEIWSHLFDSQPIIRKYSFLPFHSTVASNKISKKHAAFDYRLVRWARKKNDKVKILHYYLTQHIRRRENKKKKQC